MHWIQARYWVIYDYIFLLGARNEYSYLDNSSISKITRYANELS